MKKARRWMSLLLVGLLCVTAAACAGASGEQGAVKAAEDYLNALHDGNMKRIAALQASDADSPADLFEEDGLTQLEEMGISKENYNLFKDTLYKALGSAFSSWTIKDSEVDGDEAYVYAEVIGVNLDGLDDASIMSDAMQDAVTDWLGENLAKMEDYAADHTEEDQASWLIDQTIPTLCTAIEKTVEDLPSSTQMYRITLKKENGSWKVQELEAEADE